MSSHRFCFYSPALEPTDSLTALAGDEHHHLSRVLRLSPGDGALVTNGRGAMAACAVERVGGGETILRVERVDEVPPGRRVTLFLALLKKDRFARALEQCIELGIARCVPFIAAKSHVRSYGGGGIDRLRRVAVSAMKQSARAWLAVVDDPVSFGDLGRVWEGCTNLLVGSQGGESFDAGDVGEEVVVVVGPEGGLTADERGTLDHAGARFVSVSPYRLRSGTAAAAMAAAVLRRD